ncbi:MAG TPA: multidrug effflux MFS transporter [Pseudonocardiaceae bacterium]
MPPTTTGTAAPAAAVDLTAAPIAVRTAADLDRGVPVAELPAEPTGRRYVRFVLVLGLLIALGPLTIDLYLPALPAVSGQLAAGESAVQATLTGVLLGLAFGQLLIGPLSDAFGRRLPVLIGLAAHAVASLLCALAPTIETLIAARTLQGFAGAAISVAVMATVRDLFSGRRAAGVLSHLMLVLGVAPILAPTLGGWMLTVTDWRGLFWVLGAGALALLPLAYFGLRETLPRHRRRPARPSATLRTYRTILADRTFIGLVLIAGLTMATMFSYVSGSSFVLQGVYGLDEQTYGLVFGMNAIGLIAATQLNPVLLRRFTPQRILLGALVAAAVSVTALVFAAATQAPLALLVVPLFATASSCGLAFPNAPALALSRHGEAAGSAAALLGAAQFGVGALVAPLVGAFGSGSALPMALVMASATGLALALLLAVTRSVDLPARPALPVTG